MKANRRSATLPVLVLAALAALPASCSRPRVIPPAAPAPTPAPRPAPPPPPPPASLDWREAPITPGDWSWSIESGQSVARFAGDTLVLRCDGAGRTITLTRAGTAAGSEPLTVASTSGLQTLSASPQAGPVSALAVTLPATDRVFDAMAFSRGRFAVEAPGLTPIYVPSWPEVSRVAEDCR